MKLTLAMVKPKKWRGTLIPILHSPFVIGRDADCHLRAQTSSVNPHHCALQVRQEKAYIEPFAGEAGTFVNERQVQGEQELHDRDSLQVGRLIFTVQVEAEAAAREEQDPEPSKGSTDEEVANLLFAMEEQQEKATSDTSQSAGETVGSPEQTHQSDASKSAPAKSRSSRYDAPDTAAAARNLLARYKKPHGR
ncbi:MAG TPA: FHA domain-containing protein [Gemmataceae bacterium]|jgi:predicted component of type VI protein secretion system|nr:FHA domain-containing protein [Gemmataceae bacterium]